MLIYPQARHMPLRVRVLIDFLFSGASLGQARTVAGLPTRP